MNPDKLSLDCGSASEPTDGSSQQMFVAWVRFQRRQVSMRSYFGFELVFLPIPEISRLAKPVFYFLRTLQTLALLAYTRPDVVWVQLPQPPLLAAALMYRRLFRRTARIVADCHNPLFAPPWSRWPRLRARLNASDVVLAHNHEVVARAQKLGVLPSRIRVLVDAPADLGTAGPTTVASNPPYFLFMTTFSPEEPIAELFAAARLAPELRFVLTGDLRRGRGRHPIDESPANLHLAGYLPLEELEPLIHGATAVLGLTRNPDEQLSSAAEALGAGRPLVLSDTPTLRSLHRKGAVFIDVNDPKSIVAGCRRALENNEQLSAAAVALRGEWIDRWRAQAEGLRRELVLSDNRTGRGN